MLLDAIRTEITHFQHHSVIKNSNKTGLSLGYVRVVAFWGLGYPVLEPGHAFIIIPLRAKRVGEFIEIRHKILLAFA